MNTDAIAAWLIHSGIVPWAMGVYQAYPIPCMAVGGVLGFFVLQLVFAEPPPASKTQTKKETDHDSGYY